jgi:hypothetical protein
LSKAFQGTPFRTVAPPGAVISNRKATELERRKWRRVIPCLGGVFIKYLLFLPPVKTFSLETLNYKRQAAALCEHCVRKTMYLRFDCTWIARILRIFGDERQGDNY